MPNLLLLLSIITFLFFLGVSAHSELFHKLPLHPRHFAQNHPSHYDSILQSLKKRQSMPLASNESKHLHNIRNITFGGTNAEAYWSFNGKQFSFQGIFGNLGKTHPCDQIYIMNADGSNVTLISTGQGRDTCSYFTPDGSHLIYSSTLSSGSYCPPEPDMSYGYLWPIYNSMSIYKVDLNTRKYERLMGSGYNSESTISPDGRRIIFTSDRDGDLELYSMNLDGSELRRLTYTPGYDGGAYYSYNSKMITWRAGRPHGADLTSYLELLKLGLVQPLNMQLYYADAEGTNPVQITNYKNVVSFSPFFLPDDSGVIFSSNLGSQTGMEFQLFMIKLDGSGLEQITWEGTFNSFPMFSPDGKTLAWESNRDTKVYSDLNVYLAEWIW